MFPFLEEDLLRNCDQIEEALGEFDAEDIYAVLEKVGSGFAATFYSLEDGYQVAQTDEWRTKRELVEDIRSVLGSEVQIDL